MSKLRVGILGFGNIAQEHLNGYRQYAGAEVVAAADINPERLKLLEGTPIRGFNSAKELLDAVQVDAVSICTPPSSHAELAELALGRGVHVFCEKPLAKTAAEGRRMLEAASRAGKLLGIGFCHRFIPAVERIRELLAQGAIGEPLLYRNQFSGLFAGVEQRWFSDPEYAGGGTLMDTTVHSVDLFRFLMGEVREVRALTHISSRPLRVEDNSLMSVQAENGCLGVLEASWTVARGQLMIEIRGSAGEIIYDYDSLRFRGKDDAELKTVEVGQGIEVRFARELAHFLEAVQGKAPLTPNAQDGLRAVELLEQAYASAKG